MKQTVTVLSTSGRYARVTYDRSTACHMDCAHCSGGCGATVAGETLVVEAENPLGAAPGDRVEIETSAGAVYGAVFLVYGLPVLLFFLGYFGGEALGVRGAVTGILGFLLGLLAAVAVSRRMEKKGKKIRFRIVGFAE